MVCVSQTDGSSCLLNVLFVKRRVNKITCNNNSIFIFVVLCLVHSPHTISSPSEVSQTAHSLCTHFKIWRHNRAYSLKTQVNINGIWSFREKPLPNKLYVTKQKYQTNCIQFCWMTAEQALEKQQTRYVLVKIREWRLTLRYENQQQKCITIL